MAEFQPVRDPKAAPPTPDPKPAPKIVTDEVPPGETAHGQQDPEAYVPTPHGQQPGDEGTPLKSEPKR